MFYDVELFESNDHDELEMKISIWLKTVKPKRICNIVFVANGSQHTYCALFIYELRSRPLPEID